MQLNLVPHMFVTIVTAADLKLYDNACHSDAQRELGRWYALLHGPGFGAEHSAMI